MKIGVYCPAELLTKIDEIAARSNASRSAVVVEALLRLTESDLGAGVRPGLGKSFIRNQRGANLIGEKFTRLTVALLDEKKPGDRGQRYWICKCDCGGTKRVSTRSLRKRVTQSCGCLSREKASERMHKRHAMRWRSSILDWGPVTQNDIDELGGAA